MERNQNGYDNADRTCSSYNRTRKGREVSYPDEPLDLEQGLDCLPADWAAPAQVRMNDEPDKAADRLQSLRDRHTAESASDKEKGRLLGCEWALQAATPKMLRRLLIYRRGTASVRGPRNLANRVAMADAGEEGPGPDRVFDGFLDVRRYHTLAFLNGFIAGALEIWDSLVSALIEERNGVAVASQAAWNGWQRQRNRPWMQICEGDSESEVIGKLTKVKNGDTMALPAGQHPDAIPDETNGEGRDRAAQGESHRRSTLQITNVNATPTAAPLSVVAAESDAEASRPEQSAEPTSKPVAWLIWGQSDKAQPWKLLAAVPRKEDAIEIAKALPPGEKAILPSGQYPEAVA